MLGLAETPATVRVGWVSAPQAGTPGWDEGLKFQQLLAARCPKIRFEQQRGGAPGPAVPAPAGAPLPAADAQGHRGGGDRLGLPA